mgnify:CR=1 FL=1
MMSIDKWVKHSTEHGTLFKSIILLNKSKVCVEIGVAHGTTSKFLCEGAESVGGHLYGFDVWSDHGHKNIPNNEQYCKEYEKKYGSRLLYKSEYGQISSKSDVIKYLKSSGLSAFTMTQIDSKDSSFNNVLKTMCPKIDFAFLDGDHSYNGLKNDFNAVYPLLSDIGIIAFHDTQKIDGCREFVLDLRTKLFDGTYDIVDFPFGNGKRKVGVSLLIKRAYPITNQPIDEMCGSPSLPHEIMEREQEWYSNELRKNKKE